MKYRKSYLNNATVEEVMNLINSMPENIDFEYVVKGGVIYYECYSVRSESDDAGLSDNM